MFFYTQLKILKRCNYITGIQKGDLIKIILINGQRIAPISVSANTVKMPIQFLKSR